MQGQRGTFQFLPENLEYEYPTSSSVAPMDRQQGFRNSPANGSNGLPFRSETGSTHRHRGGRQDGGSSSRTPPPIYSRNPNFSELPEILHGHRMIENQGQSLPAYSGLMGMSNSGFSSSCGVLGEGGSESSDRRCHSSKRKSFDGHSGQSSGSSSGGLTFEERTPPSHRGLNITEGPSPVGTRVNAAQQFDVSAPFSWPLPQQHHSSGLSGAGSHQLLLPTVPVMPQVVYPVGWGGMPNPSLMGASDFHLSSRTGSNNRELERSGLSEYAPFVPSAQDPRIQSLGHGRVVIPGEYSHFSYFNPISGVPPPVTPNWIPHQGIAGQVSSSSSSLRPGVDTHTAQEPLRSTLLMGRRGTVMGQPLGLRSRHARNLMLFEQIRSALELMQREESMMIDDVMIMDETVHYDTFRDWRLDVDNMTYEELLALEERIGNVSTGVDESAVQKSLKQKKYLSFSTCKTESCCICQEDYEDGEDLGILSCGHDFHALCIGKWLVKKNVCPICKTTALPS